MSHAKEQVKNSLKRLVLNLKLLYFIYQHLKNEIIKLFI